MDININSFLFFFYFSTKTFFVGYLQCMFVSVEKYISIFIVLFLHITVFFERYVLCVLTEKISLSIHNLHFFVEKRKKKKKKKNIAHHIYLKEFCYISTNTHSSLRGC